MDQWSNAEMALYSAIFTVFMGLVFYFKLWWDGPGASWKFSRWFFGILVIVTFIVGGCVYWLG